MVDNSHEHSIPPELLRRLEQLKPTLRLQGVVLWRTEQDHRPAWRLRYRDHDENGHIHQRSLSLPSWSAAMLVQILLSAWKDQYRQEQQAQRQAEQARSATEKQEKARRRQRRRRIQDVAGGGRQHRRQIGKMYDQAVGQGWRAKVEFCLSGVYKQPRRPGRPPKARLTLSDVSSGTPFPNSLP